MIKYYTGIGSRDTSKETFKQMTKIAERLAEMGYCLRSGGAGGADSAFEEGAGENKQIFLPWKGFNNNISKLFIISDEALELASTLHPGWGYLKNSVRKLMARNCYQIMGFNLKEPCDFVVCWTKDGCETDKDRTQKTGGTGQAISLANKNGIRVYNLFNESSVKELEKLLKI